jgi:ATP-dependent RNA circularization protein (DNA/RNA ligase family)
MKYPRTYHVPFSPGATSDDKQLSEEDFLKHFAHKRLIFTEKLDGENSAITHFDCYARSHGAPTRSPWSINLWGDDGIMWRVKDSLGEDETIYGENLYGEHSIHYDRLTDYFHIFAANNGYVWYSWEDVELMGRILNLPTVPFLGTGYVTTVEELKDIIEAYMKEPSAYGDTKEGIVIRTADEFPVLVDGKSAFHEHVCKYVRANHVQTDKHWTKNWKKAKLIG